MDNDAIPTKTINCTNKNTTPCFKNMIDPQTISENFLFNTVRIEPVSAPGASGTGFFFQFALKDKGNVPVIITNKHVVKNKPIETVKFSLHTKQNKKPDKPFHVELITNWYFHPDLDLCFCYLEPLLNKIRNNPGEEIFYKVVQEDLILNDFQLEDLSAIEDVVMVGYPNGLWDKANNLPLFRKGITASHPALDFNSKSTGVVDLACFGGSSGSPIFIYNDSGYMDKKGNFNLGKQRLILLGVLFAGPRYSEKGNLIVESSKPENIISPVTPLWLNLGYYIKAKEILTFKNIVEEFISKKEQPKNKE